MDKIKLRYKKDKKVFVPEKEIDLPDNFEVEIESSTQKEEMTDEEIEKYVKKIREEFIKEYKEKYGIDKSNDPFIELIGIDAKYSMNTSYSNDKQRIMDTIWEKYHNE